MRKNSPKRILLVSPLPPAMGGISVSSDRLAQNLRADGYRVDTYNLQKKVRNRLLRTLWLLANTLWLPWRVLLSPRYDIIHLHVSSYWRRVYLWATQLCFRGAPVVVTIHGDATHYTRRTAASTVLRLGKAIICVRPGDAEKMPPSVRSRCVEIPAFMLPPNIDNLRIPIAVEGFLQKAAENDLPVLLINGMAIVDGQYPDLYGFADFADALKILDSQKQPYAALIIFNDMAFSARQKEFVQKTIEPLENRQNIMVVRSSQFSLLPIFKRNNVVYVRPTKTDGDSLSVREALALGTPVVASDVAQRPDNTIIYPHNNQHPEHNALHLADAMQQAVDTLYTPRTAHASQDFYPQILALYRRLGL